MGLLNDTNNLVFVQYVPLLGTFELKTTRMQYTEICCGVYHA